MRKTREEVESEAAEKVKAGDYYKKLVEDLANFDVDLPEPAQIDKLIELAVKRTYEVVYSAYYTDNFPDATPHERIFEEITGKDGRGFLIRDFDGFSDEAFRDIVTRFKQHMGTSVAASVQTLPDFIKAEDV
jgi:hypothetical protein